MGPGVQLCYGGGGLDHDHYKGGSRESKSFAVVVDYRAVSKSRRSFRMRLLYFTGIRG